VAGTELQYPDIIVYPSQLVGCKSLVEGDKVSFYAIPDGDGRYRAKDVTREVSRLSGQVFSWDVDKREGVISTNEEPSRKIFAYHIDIIATGPKYLIEGETVEFDLEKPRKRLAAKNIAVFQSRYPLERFSDTDRFENRDLLKSLAELSQDEDWNFVGKSSRQEYPVLYRYIKYTFERLLSEDKIVYSSAADSADQVACGNTGLLTHNYEEIVALFEPNRKKAGPDWFLSDFVRLSSRKLVSIGGDIPLANYFDRPEDLLLDPNRKILPNIEHIVEDNLSRFPVRFHDNPLGLRNAFRGALELAVKKVRRNYKTAVPQYYQGQVQLLLPLCLTEPDRADLALVLSKEGEVYRASTVLPMYVAYSNARLIAKPDSDWLQPFGSEPNEAV